MSMIEWARNEVDLLIKKRREDGPDSGWEYDAACCQSALRAYEALLADGHSGISFSLAAAILKSLLDEQPLTPIEDVPESWALIGKESKSTGTVDVYQCTRRPSLFKNVNVETGEIDFQDLNLIRCHDVNSPATFYNGFVVKEVLNRYPMVMRFPYQPTGKIDVDVESFSSIGDPDSFDTLGILTVRIPNVNPQVVNQFYAEKPHGGWESITKRKYDARKQSSKLNQK